MVLIIKTTVRLVSVSFDVNTSPMIYQIDTTFVMQIIDCRCAHSLRDDSLIVTPFAPYRVHVLMITMAGNVHYQGGANSDALQEALFAAVRVLELNDCLTLLHHAMSCKCSIKP